MRQSNPKLVAFYTENPRATVKEGVAATGLKYNAVYQYVHRLRRGKRRRRVKAVMGRAPRITKSKEPIMIKVQGGTIKFDTFLKAVQVIDCINEEIGNKRYSSRIIAECSKLAADVRKITER